MKIRALCVLSGALSLAGSHPQSIHFISYGRLANTVSIRASLLGDARGIVDIRNAMPGVPVMPERIWEAQGRKPLIAGLAFILPINNFVE
jgi:hypothetical protein